MSAISSWTLGVAALALCCLTWYGNLPFSELNWEEEPLEDDLGTVLGSRRFYRLRFHQHSTFRVCFSGIPIPSIAGAR